MAEILLYNFHREHVLLKLKTKKSLRKIKSKNLTAGVFFFFFSRDDFLPSWVEPVLIYSLKFFPLEVKNALKI